MEEKKCTKCGIEKPLSEFYSKRTQCKECVRKCVTKYAKENPEKIKENNARWRKENYERKQTMDQECYKRNPQKYKDSAKKWAKENPEDRKRILWFNKYKGTYDQWEDYRTATHCSCCGVEFTDKNKKCQDHNHDTGEVRDVICRFCNDIEGKVKDHPERLIHMMGYLLKWQTKTIIEK